MRRGRIGATATILLFCLAAWSSAASPTAAPAEAGAKPGEPAALAEIGTLPEP